MDKTKLKPCPYCGGENVRVLYIDEFNEERCVEELDDDEANTSYCYIQCNDCDIDFCPSLNSSNKIQETIEAWNRRVENDIT